MEWRPNREYRSRGDRERELDTRPPAIKVPGWVLYVALGIVAVYLLVSAKWIALAIFAGLTLAGLIVQKFAAN